MDTFVSTAFALLSVVVILMFLPEILGFGVLVGAMFYLLCFITGIASGNE